MCSNRMTWMRQVDDVLEAWRDVRLAQEREFLSGLHGVLRSAPERELVSGLNVPPSRRFHALLDVKANESAVLELLSPASSFMMSRGSEGVHVATVVLAGYTIEGTAKARTGGLAIAGAILLSLSEKFSIAPHSEELRAQSAR